MADIPNVTAHGLMALDVYNQLEESQVRDAIAKHPKAFLLGSNGPDMLFYYNVFPWQDQKLNAIVADYGHAVHTRNINDFYNHALKFIQSTKDDKRKNVLIAYVAGHFLHWSLDSLAHPFVFYRSGPLSGKSKYWHYRYESMLDALMVTYVKRKDMASLKAYRFVDVDDYEKRVISFFYQQMLSDVFGIYTKPETVASAITSFKSILKFLYDPHNLFTPLVESLENKMAEPWAFSSHIVNSKIDAKYDVLNLKKEPWSNPTDIEDVSTMSFIELYDYSVKLGVLLLHEFSLALAGERDSFDDLLENRQYDTGRPEGIQMKYYDSIYDK
ncbi:zinc dependent phospholipase C family protein [Erysipelothrix urinaevulpis]|uniref:zinc dependent phospholipase C family protein n=1 Tax=Erysipelothrix urinaevulpis TaxID=2683717 RepID=UPI001358C8D5|nr:zinc dependent phospholipase C family protein [Erysipelothrix urinaevulpis]